MTGWYCSARLIRYSDTILPDCCTPPPRPPRATSPKDVVLLAPMPTVEEPTCEIPEPNASIKPPAKAYPTNLPLRMTGSPLMPFLPIKETCPLTGISMVCPLILHDRRSVRTSTRSLEISPYAPAVTAHPDKSYSSSLGMMSTPVNRNCIGDGLLFPVTEAFASAPSITIALAKLPDGM
ncbi:hypothetical protein FF38_11458 [Lucilia cuprina]|uniref:Uncharacterized protein n=1 Tax=Lucilia cuprina TaxID=7375 RepID=A0A0L0CCU5_LUCCU|nr:hypothetical protein FF38_11458 [Lucilia cuprina]